MHSFHQYVKQLRPTALAEAEMRRWNRIANAEKETLYWIDSFDKARKSLAQLGDELYQHYLELATIQRRRRLRRTAIRSASRAKRGLAA